MTDDIAIQLAALKVAVDVGFSAVNTRIDERHREHVAWLQANAGELREIKGDLKTVHEDLRSLGSRVTVLETLSSSNAKWIAIIIALVFSVITGTVSFLMFFGKVRP